MRLEELQRKLKEISLKHGPDIIVEIRDVEIPKDYNVEEVFVAGNIKHRTKRVYIQG